MICSKCGGKLDDNGNCLSCMTNQNDLNQQNNQNTSFQNNNSVVINQGSSKFTNTQKIVIAVLLFIFICLLALYFMFFNKSNSRTIMMYIVGSNLESDEGIVTADLKAIDPNEINLDKTNILIYTGGTEKWQNFIQNTENAIYKLTKDGFEKIETYEQLNMGAPDTFTEFLNYAYDNFPADNYDLVMYDHGGAIQGAIYDDFTNDNLSLSDINTAFENSKFNKQNKLETIIFRTCLNGTTEMANILSNYAEYMVASEEITWGSKYSSVLGFVNELEERDDGFSVGKKFVDSYSKQMAELDPFSTKSSTYAIIDLDKIDEVNTQISNLVNEIDVSQNYSTISKIRSDLYQFGETSTSYDMIDLYSFAYSLSDINDYADNLMNAIDEAVVYNWTNIDESHGLSIYFPFNGGGNINSFLSIYEELGFNSDYNSFIKNFHGILTGDTSFSFDVTNLTPLVKKTEDDEREISLQLDSEQFDNFGGAEYIVFKKTDSEYYLPVYSSNDYEVDGNGLISTRLKNNMIKFVDKSDGTSDYLLVNNRKASNRNTYISSSVLVNLGLSESSDMRFESAIVHFDFDAAGKLYVSSYVASTEKDKAPSGIIFNEEEFDTIQYVSSRYKILDVNGKYTENWQRTDTMYGYEIDLDNIEYELVSLDDSGDYYCVFKVYDVQNNYTYSDLVQIK